MTNQTQINVDPDLPTIEIIREFDHPPKSVFAAYVDPELFAQWVGPRSIETRIDTWDATTGGKWAYTGIRGDDEFGFFGSFHEIRDGERIVQTFTWLGAPDDVALDTARFEELPGGRTRLRTLSTYPTLEGRDAMVVSGMEEGVIEGFEQLDELLAR